MKINIIGSLIVLVSLTLSSFAFATPLSIEVQNSNSGTQSISLLPASQFADGLQLSIIMNEELLFKVQSVTLRVVVDGSQSDRTASGKIIINNQSMKIQTNLIETGTDHNLIQFMCQGRATISILVSAFDDSSFKVSKFDKSLQIPFYSIALPVDCKR